MIDAADAAFRRFRCHAATLMILHAIADALMPSIDDIFFSLPFSHLYFSSSSPLHVDADAIFAFALLLLRFSPTLIFAMPLLMPDALFAFRFDATLFSPPFRC